MAVVKEKETSGLPTALKQEGAPVEMYGWRVFPFPGVRDPVQHITDVRAFSIRDDDILLAAYPKSGTHWIWEITHMLLRQTTTYEARTKEQVMLESPGGLTRTEEEVSPRIINSHLVFAHLPQEIKTKKTKIIHVLRNPKDTLVSLYHHRKSVLTNTVFSFSEMLDATLDGKMKYHSQFEYLHQMSDYEMKHPENPVFHIYYEEMKKEPIKVIQELSRFLNVQANDDFCQKVADACSFSNMKKLEESGQKTVPADLTDVRDPDHSPPVIYRKGIIGDWKNHFTVTENERFDGVIAGHINEGLKFQFIYE